MVCFLSNKILTTPLVNRLLDYSDYVLDSRTNDVNFFRDNICFHLVFNKIYQRYTCKVQEVPLSPPVKR